MAAPSFFAFARTIRIPHSELALFRKVPKIVAF